RERGGRREGVTVGVRLGRSLALPAGFWPSRCLLNGVQHESLSAGVDDAPFGGGGGADGAGAGGTAARGGGAVVRADDDLVPVAGTDGGELGIDLPDQAAY